MRGLILRARRLRDAKDRTWSRDQSGLAAMEFAFVAPVLLVLVFGVVVFSIYLATWIGVVHAAAEGARASVAGLTAAERQSLAATRVQAMLAGFQPLLDPAQAVVTYPATTAGLFSVTVTYPITALGLSGYASLAPVPTISPSRTATVTTGGY